MTEKTDQDNTESYQCPSSTIRSSSNMSGSTQESAVTGGGVATGNGATTGLTNSTQASAIPKAIIKNVDMSEEMQQVAVDVASEAMLKFTVEKDIAAHVKKTMDTKFGPTWHAVVGKNYGSYVTHETKHFIYFCECNAKMDSFRHLSPCTDTTNPFSSYLHRPWPNRIPSLESMIN